MFSGQTIKTGASPAMQLGDLATSSAQTGSAARTVSDATAGFPSSQSIKNAKNAKADASKKNKRPSAGLKTEKPSCFEDQDAGKDSEDAESFDEEK